MKGSRYLLPLVALLCCVGVELPSAAQQTDKRSAFLVELRAKADRGDVVTQLRLGIIYDTEKDYAEAAKWFRKAAEQGDSDAQGILGRIYRDGRGVEKDYVEAVKWFRKSADQEDAGAQFKLGVMYGNGNGVAKDEAEAVKWYRKAADQGYADAQYNLGNRYADGNGVAKDEAEAVKWYRKAADQGYANAQFNLGVMYGNGEGLEKSDVEAVKWYRKSAEQGNADAQFNLGLKYYGGQGVEKDYALAVKWFRKAADQGQPGAQSNLGLMYTNGEGVENDYAEAAKWFRKAADQGFAEAQGMLGGMYRNGRGVEKSDYEALKWWRRSAEQGHAGAQFNLGVMYGKGEGVAKDEAEAVKWYRKAADQGYADAQYNLGFMYRNGLGVNKDYVEAYAWYNIAAKTDLGAAKDRDDLEKKMSPQQVAEAQKRTKELSSSLEPKRAATVLVPTCCLDAQESPVEDMLKRSQRFTKDTKDPRLESLARNSSAVQKAVESGGIRMIETYNALDLEPCLDLAAATDEQRRNAASQITAFKQASRALGLAMVEHRHFVIAELDRQKITLTGASKAEADKGFDLMLQVVERGVDLAETAEKFLKTFKPGASPDPSVAKQIVAATEIYEAARNAAAEHQNKRRKRMDEILPR